MSVYVDDLFPANGPRWPFGEACHMFADSEKELHAMAAELGLKRRWFQPRSRFPHYDLTRTKRELAVRLGAVETDRLFVSAFLRRGGR